MNILISFSPGGRRLGLSNFKAVEWRRGEEIFTLGQRWGKRPSPERSGQERRRAVNRGERGWRGLGVQKGPLPIGGGNFSLSRKGVG